MILEYQKALKTAGKGSVVVLTAKQEKFCQNIVKGMTGKAAYFDAYDGKSEKVAEIESMKLMKRDDITARIKVLNKPIENAVQNQAISARKEQIDFIKSRISHCKAAGDENSLIRYTDMLNKIHGLYGNTEPLTTSENSVEKLDTDLLKKLSGIA